jgi:lauroyl/myristoyl acyltransferase
MRSHKLDSSISYYAIFLTVRYLPPWLCYWLGKIVVSLIYAFSQKDREGLAYNLSLVMDRPVNDSLIRKTVRQIFTNYGRYLVDFFLIPQLPLYKMKRYFPDIRGENILKKALTRGKGVILISAHLGNWEIGGSLLRYLQYPLAMVAILHNTAATNALLNHLRREKGIRIIEMDPQSPFSSIEILHHLRNNGIVAMMGDKDFSGRGRPITFFDREVLFPVGPVLMAMKSGAALMPVFVLKRPDGRYVGILEEAIPLDTNGNWDEAIDKNLSRTARIFEKYIRSNPDQWYCPDPITERIR